MDKAKAYLKNNYWLFFPMVHIIASFFYERVFFNWDVGFSRLASVPVAEGVSNTFEFVMTYIISKLISVVIIVLVWKLIFGIIQKKLPLKAVVIFCILFAILIVLCLVEWPQSIIGGGGSDHMITYMYAKSFIPYYWHSVYTSCLYAACLMVAPTPFVLPVLQCLAAVSILAYIYILLDRYTERIGSLRWIKYLVFSALLSPQFMDWITNTWRSCLHAMLTLLFFAMLIDAVLSEEKKSNKQVAAVMMIAAILSVWRSEGIIYGFLGFLAMLIWGCRYGVKRILVWMVAFLAVFFVLGRPSALGQDKYYGNDYLKVCFVNPLSNVFNSSDSNLDYEGAEEDIAAIEAVVPVSVLRQYSYLGYLSNNYSKGFEDIDQTGASEEESKAFMQATVRILLHNPKIYVKTQLNLWLASFGCQKRFYIEAYSGEKGEYNGFPLTMWENGEAELVSEPGVKAWVNSPAKNSMMNIVDNCRARYENLWTRFGNLGLSFLGQLLLILADIAMVVTEIICMFRKKRENMFFGWMALALLGVLAATIMLMPTPYITYFYGFIYCSFLLGVVYATRKFGQKKAPEK